MPSSLKTVLSATLALLATVGLSLAALRRGAAESANPPPAKSSPPFAVRELYAVGHFGNSYEVMGEYEMRRYLAEAKRWGFNRYADWFDMEDCSDPFAEKGLVLLSHAMWERKKQNFRFCAGSGPESATWSIRPITSTSISAGRRCWRKKAPKSSAS